MRVVQSLVDAYECLGDLDDAAAIQAAVRTGCAAVGAHIVRLSMFRYAPIGTTVVALLRESHVTVTTWPEHRYAVVDVFLCNPFMDPARVWGHILPVLRPRATRRRTVIHSIGAHRLKA